MLSDPDRVHQLAQRAIDLLLLCDRHEPRPIARVAAAVQAELESIIVSAYIPDLRRTNVVLVVWAMHGCGPCNTYLPQFMERVEAHAAAGAPFRVWSPGQPIKPGEIPVLFYDAASKDDGLQDFADRLGVAATPTTYMLTRTDTVKLEGAKSPDEIDRLLESAQRANR
jgi:hypothetical protein